MINSYSCLLGWLETASVQLDILSILATLDVAHESVRHRIDCILPALEGNTKNAKAVLQRWQRSLNEGLTLGDVLILENEFLGIEQHD